MSDRHFDLNAAIALAASEVADDPEWITFDLGPNYLEPPSGKTDKRTEEQRRKPWRMNVRDLPGWLVMDFLTSDTVRGSMKASKLIIQAAVDPEQWPQLLDVLTDPKNKVLMPVIDTWMNQIIRSQLGLPLDR